VFVLDRHAFETVRGFLIGLVDCVVVKAVCVIQWASQRLDERLVILISHEQLNLADRIAFPR
jgi:hypothetical protein